MKKDQISRGCGRVLRVKIKGRWSLAARTLCWRPQRLRKLHLALIDADDLVEHVERLVARALEGVSSEHRAVGTTAAQTAVPVQPPFQVLSPSPRTTASSP